MMDGVEDIVEHHKGVYIQRKKGRPQQHAQAQKKENMEYEE